MQVRQKPKIGVDKWIVTAMQRSADLAVEHSVLGLLAMPVALAMSAMAEETQSLPQSLPQRLEFRDS